MILDDLDRFNIKVHLGGFEYSSIQNRLCDKFGNYNFIMIDPQNIAGKLHFLFAISRANLHCSQSNMKTKILSSEIVYQLSTSSNINMAKSQFSISSSSKAAIMIFIDTDVNIVNEALLEIEPFLNIDEYFDGHHVNIKTADQQLIKTFGLKNEELKISNLEDAIINSVAIKDF